MSTKYLGKQFDIHGGGMDLMFPHHECEIAQAKAGNHTAPAKYWLHNNMITINGQKMGKSLGNFITLQELFSGENKLLERSYSPMTIRFFILQAQYRSTLDFSNEALLAAQKGYKKIANGLKIVKQLSYQHGTTIDSNLNKEIETLCDTCIEGMYDDFNTAITIANLFNLLKRLNSFYTKSADINTLEENTFKKMKDTFLVLTEDVLGIKEEKDLHADTFITALLDLYKNSKDKKEYDKVDEIRAYFKKEGLVIKDMKHGIDWAYEE
jgi:cysteinyl-tRNA synthetase